MLIIAGTVAFEGKKFISVAVTTKKGQEDFYFPTLAIKLEDKDMSVSSDNPAQIKKMYIDVLKQLRGYPISREVDGLIDEAAIEVDNLMREIQVLNSQVRQSMQQEQPPREHKEFQELKNKK